MKTLNAVAIACLAALALSSVAAEARECAGGPCEVLREGKTLGEYRLRQPGGSSPRASGPRPVVIFLHGWRGAAKNVIGGKSLQNFADEIGAILVAPQGQSRSWSYQGSPTQLRDEFAFFDALREDLIAKHNADPDRILVSGFSMGASMAWSLACARGDDYWGFVAFAGAFWEPLPNRCAKPSKRLVHIHGESDGVVPIAGRPIGDRWRQGDVRKSLSLLVDALKLKRTREGLVGLAGFDCLRWGGPDRLVKYCRHEGGHVWRTDWLRAAYHALLAR